MQSDIQEFTSRFIVLRDGMSHREPLAKEIERIHESPALWEATVPVREVVDGEVIFDGKVDVYLLVGHDKAKRCYAWISVTSAGETRLHTMLEIPPIVSAADAVRTAAASTDRRFES